MDNKQPNIFRMLGFGREKNGIEKLDLRLLRMREELRAELQAAEIAGNKTAAAMIKAKMLISAGGSIEKQQPRKLLQGILG